MSSSLTIIWIAILAAYCIPLWDKVYWSYGRPFSPAFATVFYTLCRVIWTVCTSLMIWLCISGKGGLINTFLSHRAFVPMARLTYSVYLCHAWLIWYFMGSRRHVMDTHMYNVLINFIHITVMSYIMGFLFFVVFESPILELQKYGIESFGRKHENRDKTSVELKLNLKSNYHNNNV
ncbi:unnamed protein product [Medioppia subpectinata]|uniref:Acyltransferase 3 domain-containing protein n=1 Tax=Medioppia subpectinata TaxID=1979941 RepID=A0A7R9Q7C5_9ACAR|nr:unnamed protein product [Medioppia subpectinata]CAG2114670.1 unnamed protein product [Medioppia subpectinata]